MDQGFQQTEIDIWYRKTRIIKVIYNIRDRSTYLNMVLNATLLLLWDLRLQEQP